MSVPSRELVEVILFVQPGSGTHPSVVHGRVELNNMILGKTRENSLVLIDRVLILILGWKTDVWDCDILGICRVESSVK